MRTRCNATPTGRCSGSDASRSWGEATDLGCSASVTLTMPLGPDVRHRNRDIADSTILASGEFPLGEHRVVKHHGNYLRGPGPDQGRMNIEFQANLRQSGPGSDKLQLVARADAPDSPVFGAAPALAHD